MSPLCYAPCHVSDVRQNTVPESLYQNPVPESGTKILVPESSTRIFLIATRALATYLIPGCVGRGFRLGSESSSAGGGVWKSGNLEIWEFGDLGIRRSGDLEIKKF